MTTYLVALGLSPAQATALAAEYGCGGYYLTLPPVWVDVATEQGWTYPCVVTVTDGVVSSWDPV